jgi:predicted dehydrogenase
MKIGLIGLDSFFFSQMFVQSLRSIPGAVLVGCTTNGIDEEEIRKNNGLTSQEFSAKFQLPVYGSMEELAEREQPDAVVITTRPSAMPPLLKQAVDRGLHAYVAKPVAVLEEHIPLLKGLQQGDSIISAGPTARFDPAIRQARDRVVRNEIGNITAIRVMHQHGMLKFWPKESWYYDVREGGIEYFLAWYCIDLIHWFTGQQIVAAEGFAANTVDKDSPHADVLKAACRLSAGAVASLDVLFNVSWPYPSYEIEAIGTNGAIRIQQDQFDGALFTQQGKTSFGRAGVDTLTEELRDWVMACRGEAQTSMRLEDIVRVAEASALLARNLKVSR